MLPNFLCLGAQKSGTTTLLEQLGKHPDVFMSPARETRFFLQDHLYAQGITAYETEFFSAWAGEKAIGEKTPEYLCDPLVPGRIRESLGDTIKFIVTLRSPAQRAFAHYRQNFQFMRESVDFDTAMDLEEERSSGGRYQRLTFGYRWRGYYADQLERYLAIYARSAFFFSIYEQDIVDKQAKTLQSIFGFLGVDETFNIGAPVSAGRARLMQPRIIEERERIELLGFTANADAGDILLVREGIRPRLMRRPSAALQARARSTILHAPQDTALSRANELEINRRYFKDDICRLETILNRSLATWLN